MATDFEKGWSIYTSGSQLGAYPSADVTRGFNAAKTAHELGSIRPPIITMPNSGWSPPAAGSGGYGGSGGSSFGSEIVGLIAAVTIAGFGWVYMQTQPGGSQPTSAVTASMQPITAAYLPQPAARVQQTPHVQRARPEFARTINRSVRRQERIIAKLDALRKKDPAHSLVDADTIARMRELTTLLNRLSEEAAHPGSIARTPGSPTP